MLKIFEKLVGSVDAKKEYKEMMKRVKLLPPDYYFAFNKMQKYMWKHAAGNGYDMLHIQYEIIELFEIGASSGKNVVEIVGEDVASFCDELLKTVKTYNMNWHNKLNRDMAKRLGQRDEKE